MSDPQIEDVNVRYRDAKPQRVTVETLRSEKNFTYLQEYTFSMDGSSAVLVSLEGDGDSYPVLKNEATRALAKETVEALPFVQGVVMIE